MVSPSFCGRVEAACPHVWGSMWWASSKHNPMGTACSRTQREQARDQLREKEGAILEPQTKQIDAQTGGGILENGKNLVHARCAARIAKGHHRTQRAVVPFRIDDAHLVGLFD